MAVQVWEIMAVEHVFGGRRELPQDALRAVMATFDAQAAMELSM